MNARQLSSTAFAIVGILILQSAVRIVVGLITFPVFLQDDGGLLMLILLILYFVAVLTVGVFVIVQRHRLARWAMGEPDVGHQQDTDALSDVLIVMTGILLIAFALPSVGYLVPQLLQEIQTHDVLGEPVSAGPTIGQAIGTAAQVIIGVLLIAKHKTIAGRAKKSGS